MDYRCRYTYEDRSGFRYHTWSCIGARGGLHLHITEHPDADRSDPLSRFSGGIEVHYRQPPEHAGDSAPSSDDCWLLRCPCWHDGSSTAARERWIPLWQSDPNDHGGMFRALQGEMVTRFEGVGFLGRVARLREEVL